MFRLRWGLALAVGTCLALGGGVRARAHGGLELRLAHVTRAVALDPGNPAPLLRRAELHRRRGDVAAAHADLDRAARIAPGLREVDYRRAELLLEEGAAERALELLDRLLEAEPGHLAGQLARAGALAGLERPLEAAAAYTRTLERMPRATPEVYLERARALAAAGSALEAIASLDEGLEALGPLATLAQAAVELELRASRPAAALARVEAEIARSRQPLWWLVRKAELLEAAGRGEEARAAYAEAWRQLGEQPSHRRNQRGWRALEARIRAAWSPPPRREGGPR